MNIKTTVNKTPLIIGIILVACSELVLHYLPEIDENSASLMEMYQQALDLKFWNGMAILGWSICFIWIIVFWLKKQWLIKNECKSCGAQIKSKDDIFCRQCGAKLKDI